MGPETNKATLLLFVGVALGCGDRTGFLDVDRGSSRDEPDAAEAADEAGAGAQMGAGAVGQSAGQGGSGGGAELCDPFVGPVPSDALIDGSSPQECNPNYPHCVDIDGLWLCCRGPGPYDGPTGTCL